VNSEKKLLFVRGADDISPSEENLVRSIAKPHGYECQVVSRTVTNDEIAIGCVSMLYIAGHGDQLRFGGSTESTSNSWEQFVSSLCHTNCILPGSIAFLSCCHGGNLEVAKKVFSNCPNLEYIVGVDAITTGAEMSLAFHAFVYLVSEKSVSAAEAVKRVSEIVGKNFCAISVFEQKAADGI
jgi:hypothetical protein